MLPLPGSQQGASSQGWQGKVPELQSHATIPDWQQEGQMWSMQIHQLIRLTIGLRWDIVLIDDRTISV